MDTWSKKAEFEMNINGNTEPCYSCLTLALYFVRHIVPVGEFREVYSLGYFNTLVALTWCGVIFCDMALKGLVLSICL